MISLLLGMSSTCGLEMDMTLFFFYEFEVYVMKRNAQLEKKKEVHKQN